MKLQLFFLFSLIFLSSISYSGILSGSIIESPMKYSFLQNPWGSKMGWAMPKKFIPLENGRMIVLTSTEFPITLKISTLLNNENQNLIVFAFSEKNNQRLLSNFIAKAYPPEQYNYQIQYTETETQIIAVDKTGNQLDYFFIRIENAIRDYYKRVEYLGNACKKDPSICEQLQVRLQNLTR